LTNLGTVPRSRRLGPQRCLPTISKLRPFVENRPGNAGCYDGKGVDVSCWPNSAVIGTRPARRLSEDKLPPIAIERDG